MLTAELAPMLVSFPELTSVFSPDLSDTREGAETSDVFLIRYDLRISDLCLERVRTSIVRNYCSVFKLHDSFVL